MKLRGCDCQSGSLLHDKCLMLCSVRTFDLLVCKSFAWEEISSPQIHPCLVKFKEKSTGDTVNRDNVFKDSFFLSTQLSTSAKHKWVVCKLERKILCLGNKPKASLGEFPFICHCWKDNIFFPNFFVSMMSCCSLIGGVVWLSCVYECVWMTSDK